MRSKLAKKTLWKNPFYIKISLEGQTPFQTAFLKEGSDLSWKDTYTLDKQIGEVQAIAQSLFGGIPSVSLDLWNTGGGGVPQRLPTSLLFTLSSLSKDADVSRLREEEVIQQARSGLKQMSVAPSALSRIQRVSDVGSEVLSSAKSFEDIWGSLLGKLELFMTLLNQLSAIHPFVQTACFVLSAVPKAILAQQRRDDSVFHLMETINDVHSFLEDAEPLKTIKTHHEILEELSALTVECAYLIRDYTVDKKFWTRMANITLAGVQSKVQQYDGRFKELKARFNERAIVRVDIMMLRCLDQIQKTATDHIIDDLLYADDATYDPSKVCIPGTRASILIELHQWINEPDTDDGARVLVLTGDPGLGKSAIANTLAEHYNKVKRLGSFVSFSRADQLRRHPGNLLSTVARDIADLDPQWRAELCRVVENNRALRKTTSPIRQMENFILGPAKSLTMVGPLVVIVDALDESGAADTRKPLLETLLHNAPALPRNFRLIVTTRPEKDILRFFADQQHHIQLKPLHTMDPATIDQDISVFIQRQLTPVVDTSEKERLFKDQWLGRLVTESNHSFQWAATACRAILEAEEHGVGHATGLVAEILEAGLSLDDLYTLILRREFPEQDALAIPRFKRVMGCILVAKEPISRSSYMEIFCDVDNSGDFQFVLTPLGSVLNGVNNNDPITTRHISFFDFLTDENRSLAYFIDPTQYYEHFTWSCIQLLNSRLAFNICKLKSSYMANTTLPDLADSATEHIGPTLAYVSHFLGQHLEQTPYSEIILDGLRVLLQEHLLYWLEVMSLLKQMGTASKSFASIHAWAQGHDADLAAFAKDAIRFVETFAAPIAQSVPHIYLSALPFAPTHSLVSQTYLPQYPSTAGLKAGKLDRWPAMLKTFEVHTGAVWAVACSPNGNRIASASADGTIRVCETETGETVGTPFRGHTNVVRSIAYSPSGHHIVSGSEDHTARIWDPETGELVGSLLKHSDKVYSVAYSPDGTHIFTSCADGFIFTWDAETGEAANEPIKAHSGKIWSVAYSPNGSHMAFSKGNMFSIWDLVNKEYVGEPLKGHRGDVFCVLYSPDGKYIASCSWDHGDIWLWDAETRQAVGLLEGHTSGVVSLAFSPDGVHLVSASRDKTIRVWDVKARKPAGAPLEGHASAVFSVAYSPDGTHIVSGSDDGTVRVWDAEEVGFEAAGAALHGSSNTFLSMAYSPDGASIVSGSREGKIQMWDGNTGQLRPTPISGHHKDVNAVAFSPDWTRIVSGSDDCTVQVWDVLTGEVVGAPFKGHTKEVLSVGYSPDGSQIVSSSFDGTVRTWNANSCEALGEPFNHDGSKRVWCAAYSPDGMHVVSGGDDATLRIWSIKTGEQIRVLSGHTNGVACVAYSPDGTRIVSGSWDKTICLWDAESGEAIGSPLLGHDEMIESVAFSPDGKNILSGSRDRTLRMWGAETRELVGAPIKVHGDDIMAVASSPDGTRIASASRDCTIRIWDVAKMEASADSERSAEFRHDCRLENGWIVTASGQLLLWVPPWNRQGLVWPSNVAVVAPSLTELDLADFVHGSDWVSCKADAKVAGAGL
ncbi:hypothetical protein HWV62_35584 [Athelia sp. TMB]|nr:hypothetical protein HWV62_35584 [Athelia sp. TMB]